MDSFSGSESHLRPAKGLAHLSEEGRPVSLLLVEDDPMVRSWVRLSLRASEFRVDAEASNAVEALGLAHTLEPDFLLVDYRLPDHLGTELVRELRTRGVTAPALMMTANRERGFNEAAYEVGAQGSVLKTGSPIDLLDALRTVLEGSAVSDGHHPPRGSGWSPLTPRQREILVLVAAGRSNAEIAGELGIGVETVKTQLNRLFRKLGVRTRAQAVAVARDLGII
jgi:DNA-binding NarL/FixJ family response regulator